MRKLIYVILVCLTSVAHSQTFVTEEWKYGVDESGKSDLLQTSVSKQKLILPTDGRIIAKDTLDNYCQAVKYNYKSGMKDWWGSIVRVGDIEMLIGKYTTIQYSGNVLDVYRIIINSKGEEWQEHTAWYFDYCPTVGFYYADDFGYFKPQYMVYILNSKVGIDKDIIKVLLKNRHLLGNALECD